MVIFYREADVKMSYWFNDLTYCDVSDDTKPDS